MQGSAASAVVRLHGTTAVLFKRLLDIGVQSLLVPFVQSADEARLRGCGDAVSTPGRPRRGDDDSREPVPGA